MYKDYISKVKDVDGKGQVLVAANALGNEDYHGDISMEGSFQKTIKEGFPKLRWYLNHKQDILLGVPLEAKEEYPYLKVLGQLNMQKEVSRDVYEDYKLYAQYDKSLDHSVSVYPVKRDERDRRKVKEWRWSEYSTLTMLGANPNTPMLSMKSMDEITDNIDWLELCMKKANYTDERFKQIESHISILRSLCIEPDASTQVVKPDEQAETIVKAQAAQHNAILQKLNSINQLLKAPDNGRERIGKNPSTA